MTTKMKPKKATPTATPPAQALSQSDELALLLKGERPIVWGLRTSKMDGTSHGGYQWPDSGWAEAPDWNLRPECGGGLHFLKNGAGDADLLIWNADSLWQAVISFEDETVDIRTGKSKAMRCFVAASGSRAEATQLIYKHAPPGTAIHGLILTGGYRATLTGGDRATLTGGHRATLTGGHRAMLTGGNRATLTGGDRAMLTGGHRAMLTGGDDSTLTGGDGATLTGGDDSTLTGGHRATLTGGHRAMLTGGDGATLTGGHRAMLTGGDRASLIWSYIDANKRVLLTAIVGENGIEPNKPYTVQDGKIVPVE